MHGLVLETSISNWQNQPDLLCVCVLILVKCNPREIAFLVLKSQTLKETQGHHTPGIKKVWRAKHRAFYEEATLTVAGSFLAPRVVGSRGNPLFFIFFINLVCDLFDVA
jgi:hypothetical protein